MWNPAKKLRKNVEPSKHATEAKNKELQIQHPPKKGSREIYEPFTATEPSSLSLRVDHQGVASRGILKNAEFPTREVMQPSPNEPTKWRNSERAEMGFTSDSHGVSPPPSKVQHNLRHPLRGR